MSNIVENLQKILSSRYGKDVRQAIHDAIHDCYEDGSAGAIDLVAREDISQINEHLSDKLPKVKDDIKYITGVIAIDGSSGGAPDILSDTINAIQTDGHIAIIDVIVTRYGNRHITGYLYPDKKYGNLTHTAYSTDTITICRIENNARTYKTITPV